MAKWAAFDLEVARDSGESPGIGCVAVALSDDPNPIVLSGDDELGRKGSQAVVALLYGLVQDNYQLVGYETLGEKLQLLSKESDNFPVCRALALGHVDIYFQILCEHGHAPGFERMALGLGLPGKNLQMDNTARPGYLWFRGYRQRVITRCIAGARQVLQMIVRAGETRALTWRRANQTEISIVAERWLTVAEALALPRFVNDDRDRLSAWLDNRP